MKSRIVKLSKMELTEEAMDFVRRLTLMKDEAARLQLWETMHALEVPIKKVGWELEEILTGKRKDHLGG